MGSAMGSHSNTNFDVIISDLATPANNPESSYWTVFSIKFNLHFIELPEALLARIHDTVKGAYRVTARREMLRGMDRHIKTIGRSGESVFARVDAPDEAVYAIAKAIDKHRAALKWYMRPYSYDTRTVWKNGDVPLHPGAEQYYREMGYLPSDKTP